MKANPIAKSYSLLTPEERFRLILAAGGRGDDIERDRLARSGKRVSVSVPNHLSYSHAFVELELLTYIEVSEDASAYIDALDRFNDYLARSDAGRPIEDVSEVDAPGEQAEESDSQDDGPDVSALAYTADSPTGKRFLALAKAAGYVLQAKVDGWKLFCDELNASPFSTWQEFPGFDRLMSRLAHAKENAFELNEFQCWMNALRRRSGTCELTAVPLTANGVAGATEKAFRERVRWWSG